MTEQKVKTKKNNPGVFIIANAIVWGAVMIGISMTLKGTDYYAKLVPILSVGAAFSVILLPGGLLIKKKK